MLGHRLLVIEYLEFFQEDINPNFAALLPCPVNGDAKIEISEYNLQNLSVNIFLIRVF